MVHGVCVVTAALVALRLATISEETGLATLPRRAAVAGVPSRTFLACVILGEKMRGVARAAMVVLRARRLLNENSIGTVASPGCTVRIFEKVPSVALAAMVVVYARCLVDKLAVGALAFVRLASGVR